MCIRDSPGGVIFDLRGDNVIRHIRIVDAFVTAFNEVGEVLTDKPIKKSSSDKLLKIPAVNGATHFVGDFPNSRLQFVSLLYTVHIN